MKKAISWQKLNTCFNFDISIALSVFGFFYIILLKTNGYKLCMNNGLFQYEEISIPRI